MGAWEVMDEVELGNEAEGEDTSALDCVGMLKLGETLVPGPTGGAVHPPSPTSRAITNTTPPLVLRIVPLNVTRATACLGSEKKTLKMCGRGAQFSCQHPRKRLSDGKSRSICARPASKLACSRSIRRSELPTRNSSGKKTHALPAA